MSEEGAKGGRVIRWSRAGTSTESPHARNLRARTAWAQENQPHLIQMVKSKPLWHRDYDRQEYLTSDRRTCLFASTANGARDLRIEVPRGFETSAVTDASLRPFFEGGNGNFLLTDAGRVAYAQFSERHIPGLKVLALPMPVDIESVIHRLNQGLPTIVFIGEGTHAVELNGVSTDGQVLKFGMVDPLRGRWEHLSLQQLIERTLRIDAEGLLPTIALTRK